MKYIYCNEKIYINAKVEYDKNKGSTIIINQKGLHEIDTYNEPYIEANSIEELCLIDREKGIRNSRLYVKLDHRLNKFYGKDKGKLSSEVYPHHNLLIQDVCGYCKEVFIPDDKYWIGCEDEIPFIKELWVINENNTKLTKLASRKDEFSEWIFE